MVTGKAPKIVDTRNKHLVVATELLHNKNHCYYSQAPNRWDWHRSKTLSFPFTSDCSGTCTAICWFAGNPNDPNGVGWGYGNTKTILDHAKVKKLIINKAQLLQGDFILLGMEPDGVTPKHVVMKYNDNPSNPLCFSMGGDSDPSLDLLSGLLSIGKPIYVRNVTRA